MKSAKLLLLALAGALSLSSMARAAPGTWLATWGASPMAPSVGAGAAQSSPSYNNQTVREVVRLSAGGRQIRVRLTNEYGTQPLAIGAAHVALAGANGAIKAGTDRALTFDGKPTAIIPPGAPLLSDPVDLPVPDLADLSVSLYLPGDTGPCTCHATGVATTYVSAKGDAAGAADFPTATTNQARAFLSGVEVLTTRPGKAIVVFGDSISDGYRSTPDTNNRWPDILADRLFHAKAGPLRSVVNEGISGNRLLHDGMGTGALSRFDRDVLAQPDAGYVVLFMGINDIGFSKMARGEGATREGMRQFIGAPVTAADIIAADRQIIARAHAHGLKIYGGTLTPYEGASYASVQGEADRQAVNAWIRSSHAFDGVIDFDAVWRDPGHPARINPAFDAGDHLHGNDAGYRALGSSVDLSMFR